MGMNNTCENIFCIGTGNTELILKPVLFRFDKLQHLMHTIPRKASVSIKFYPYNFII